MFVRYMAGEGEKYLWEEDDSNVFKKIEGCSYYKKCVYLYPTEKEMPSLWLWVVGHEKSDPLKFAENRVWRTRLILHFCVKGKGFYNGEPITPGTAFVSWPLIPHSIAADPNDPFEFYWLMIRGEEVVPFAKKMGLDPLNLIFPCDYIGEIVPLLEHYIHLDHKKIDLLDYSTALMKMAFSFQKKSVADNSEGQSSGKHYNNYVELGKHFLHDNNFSLSVSELSNMLGISPKHFNRVFKEAVGISPKQYIMERRLELALTLLRNGMLPTEVATIVGYQDYTLFYRAFTKQYGIAPKNIKNV
ncbi:MAG: helix-turn-helix domain-containing protein [Clostridia bacterium]|nr:helix-turn-helix domain-containing protein [Clostridia bacterium]